MRDASHAIVSLGESSLQPGDFVGKFRIEGRLGSGGMGDVYRALDTELLRRVAIKVLRTNAGRDDEAESRLLREARAAAALEHPAVVTIYEIGSSPRGAYIAMELLDGRSLREAMIAERLTFEQKCGWLADIADALAAAHAGGVVHRDVKPENIIVTRTNEIRVVDFGIARTPSLGGDVCEDGATLGALGTITEKGKVIGTIAYMAPDQLRGDPIDGRVDQFAWGVMAFELFAGALPWWPETDPVRIISRILGCDAPLVRERGTTIPVAVEAVIARALSRDPALRFPQMDPIARALRAASHVSAAFGVTTPAIPATSPLATIPPPSRTVRLDRGSGSTLAVSVDAVSAVPSRARASHGRRIALVALTACIVIGSIAFGRMRTVRAVATQNSETPPSRSTCSEPAATEYRHGLRLIHESNWGKAQHRFEDAIALDPECADAHFRRAIVGRWGYPTTTARAAYQSAVERREKLSVRDARLLAAFEPMLARDPPDESEWTKRLVALAEGDPRDPELAMLASTALATRDPAKAESLSRRAVAQDPGYADAWQTLGDALHRQGKTTAALDAIEHCMSTAPSSTDCLLDRTHILKQQGECGLIATSGRTWIARDANAADAYYTLVLGLVGDGNQRASMTALEQRWALLPNDVRPSTRLWEAAEVAVRFGDFAQAAQDTRELARVIGSQRDLIAHVHYTRLAVDLAIESGDTAQAKHIVQEFVDQAPAWSRDIHDYPHQIMPTFEPWLIAARHQLDLLGGADLERAKTLWLAGDDAHRQTATIRWAVTEALAARDGREATQAVDAMPPAAPGIPVAGDALAQGATGRALVMAGRPNEALAHLRAATRTCSGFEEPFAETRAYLWLGKALEQQADTKAACAAYRIVLDRWGSSKPRSITAEEARRRSAAVCVR